MLSLFPFIARRTRLARALEPARRARPSIRFAVILDGFSIRVRRFRVATTAIPIEFRRVARADGFLFNLERFLAFLSTHLSGFCGKNERRKRRTKQNKTKLHDLAGNSVLV
jgi:hypothetical protein